MEFMKIFLLLTAFTIGAGTILPTDISIQNGAIVQQLDKTKIIEGKMLVPIKIKSYGSTLTMLEKTTEILVKVLTKTWFLLPNNDNSNKKIVLDKVQKLSDQIWSIKIKLPKYLNLEPIIKKHLSLKELLNTHLQTNLKNTNTDINTRIKRGLINLVGYGMKFLYGTATSDDIESVKTMIYEHNTNIHSQVLQLDLKVDKLGDILSNAVDVISQLRNTLNNVSNARSKFIEFYNLIQTLEEMNTELHFLSIRTDHLNDDVVRMQKGEIPSFFTYENLKEIITHAKTKFQTLDFPIILQEDATYVELTNLNVLKIKQTKNNYLFVLEVPLVHRQHDYQLYHLHEFPILSNHNDVLITEIDNYLAISSKGYIKINIQKCSHSKPNNIFVCNNDFPIFSKKSPSCSLNIIENNSLTNCSFKKINLSFGLYSKKINDIFYVFIEKTMNAVIACDGNDPSTIETFTNDHILVIRESCSLKTKYFHIQNTKISNYTLRNSVHHVPNEMVIVNYTDQFHINNNLTENIAQSIDNLKNSYRNWTRDNKLEEAISTWNTFAYYGTHPVTYTSAIVILVVMAIVALVCYCKCCRS